MLTSGTTRHSLITAHTVIITMYYSKTQRECQKENTPVEDVEQIIVQLQEKKNTVIQDTI